MLKRKDILEELLRERESVWQDLTLEEARALLQEESIANERIVAGLRGKRSELAFPSESKLDPARIFSITEIRHICINFRMRFLNAKYFKGEIPAEAVSKTREIERLSGTELNHFLILAPRRLFQLADADADPMLFIPLASGKYYLVHKWGMDMNWHRKLLSYPLQSINNLIVSIICFAATVALLTPNSIITPESNFVFNGVFDYWGFHRVTFFFHLLILFSALSVFFLFTFHQNFSDSEWNRKTFN